MNRGVCPDYRRADRMRFPGFRWPYSLPSRINVRASWPFGGRLGGEPAMIRWMSANEAGRGEEWVLLAVGFLSSPTALLPDMPLWRGIHLRMGAFPTAKSLMNMLSFMCVNLDGF